MNTAVRIILSLSLLLTLLVVGIPADTDELDSYYYSNGGQYYAIITSGDVGDFGYNYIINAGRVQMEYQLNMSNTLFVADITDNVTCIKTGLELVAEGYRVIISGTLSHGNCMTVLATKYTNLTFVQYGSKSSLPNLSYISWSNSEFWFAIGVFAGATSINDKVGFIHPGLTEGSVSSINAFYSGVKYANSSLQVYTMFTGAYIAADRAIGASDVLLNQIGVGALTGQQDDLTVPVAAMNAGLLAIGVSGYSLRQLYGELVGISFVRDWTAPLATYAPAVFYTSPMKYDTAKNFKNGGQYTDTKSHLVTDEQWAIMQAAMAQLKLGKTIYYCGAWMSEFGVNSTTGCTTNTSAFTTLLLSDVHNLGYYNVPLTEDGFPIGTRIGIIVTTGILLAIPIIFAIAVIALRDNPEIKAGSPFFFLIMLVGCTIVYIGVIIWPLNPSVNNCYARIWLPSLGATIAISALLVKNIRIFLLFFNPFKFRAEKLSIKNSFPFVLIMVILDVIILAIYTGIGPRGVHVEQGTNGLSTYETRHVCATSDKGNAIIYTILAFHMFQLLAGCVVSFMLRNVTNREFNERKAVGFAIYVITFCLVIVTVLIGVTSISNQQLVLFVAVALLICNTAALLIIFGSRFVDAFTTDPQEFVAKPKTSSGGSHGSAKSGTSDVDSANSRYENTRKTKIEVTTNV